MIEPTLAEVTAIVRSMKRIAVLGAHEKPERPAHYVPKALHDGGLEVFPVNERFTGKTLFDRIVVGTLAELAGPIDVVDVFRRSDILPTHKADIFAMSPLPKVVWLQTGIEHAAFAQELRERAIVVVQSRCLMVDFRELRG